jgi:hypothetical protein
MRGGVSEGGQRMSKSAPVSFGLVRHTVRYYAKNRRWRALIRATWLTTVRRCGMELCQFCGGRYLPNEHEMNPFCWWAPTSLWAELIDPNGHGLCCPGCFDQRASDAGYRLMWTPLVWRDDDDILDRVDAIAVSAKAGNE